MTDDPVARTAERYTNIAPAYVRWFSPVIRPMAAPLLSALPLASARRTLDVGCGTGAFLDALPNPVGIDRSIGMLRFARSKAPVALADAAAFPIAPASIDVAIAVFMMHHLPSPPAALAEMRRVVRRGCVAATATWGSPRDHGAYLALVEEIDAAGAPPISTLDNTELLSTPERVEALFLEAGFGGVHAWSERKEHVWNRDAFWNNYIEGSRTRQRIDALPEPERGALIERIRARLDQLDDEAWIWRPDVVYCTGLS